MSKNNTEKFTIRFQDVLEQARMLALYLKKEEVGLKELLWSLTRAKGSLAHEILFKSGLEKLEECEEYLNSPETQKEFSYSEDAQTQRNKCQLSDQLKKTIERAVYIAAELFQPYVGTEHLLYALLIAKDKEVNKLLIINKIDINKLLDQLKFIFKSTANFGDVSNMIHYVSNLIADEELSDEEGEKILDQLEEETETPLRRIGVKEEQVEDKSEDKKEREKDKMVHKILDKRKKTKMSVLDYFSTNLTDKKTQQNIDPVIGRKREIQRMIQILLRRNKNNPVLLGDPGVGKTAIVEGLAKKIIQDDVPDILLNKKIYALDMNMLVAGTIMRGEFEARLKQIIDEIKKDPEVIIFIDEIHNIVGAGSVTGTMDAANILKPALARGELRCIGATTHNEYKKYIESDSALERRFQAVQVPEPSIAETIEILKGIRQKYEKYHLVKITNSALEAAAKLSHQYLPEKFLPDKAIDLIDEAAARIKVKTKVVDENIRQLKLLEHKIKDIEEQKLKLVSAENYNEALKLKQKQIKLFDQMYELEKSFVNKKDIWLGRVTEKDVAQIVSDITRVPLGDLIQVEKNKMLNLDKVLGQKIIGQNNILKELSFYLKRSRAGLSGRNRPLGSFMFLGPSGVGKTETAKVLAQEIFATHNDVSVNPPINWGVNRNQKGSLIRLDMSEFAESFNISRLIGSPAGYVGFREGGRLTEAVRRNPYSLVLFDEIEKAHPEVFNVLLQILDDGILSDATGKQVNFKNTVIILTSNLGLKTFEPSKLGFSQDTDKKSEDKNKEDLRNHIMLQVKQHFRPEFLNRLDKIFVFNSLDLKSVEKIIELQLNELAENLKSKKLKLSWSKKLITNLTKLSYSTESGARNVRRVVEKMVENDLADKILSGQIKSGQEVKLDFSHNKVVFEKEIK